MPLGVSTIAKGAGKLIGNKKAVIGGGILTAGDIAMNVSGGDDIGTAAAKTAFSGLLFASNPVLYVGGTVLSTAASAGWGIEKFNYQKKNWWQSQFDYNNTVGGNYVDTQRAQTMRQAAVQAIQGSKLNARSALGGEAKILNPYSQLRSY